MKVATDVGGTFTDLVATDPARETLITAKSHSTPPDFERGALDVLHHAELDPSAVRTFIHGTTVVINTITEWRGACVGLLTTRGFRDVLEIGRGNRPDLYNFTFRKPIPIVPRDLRMEITERIGPDGEVRERLRLAEVRAAAARLRDAGATAVAICFLHSYANPRHELQAAEAVREVWPEADICTSGMVSRQWREYERTSTTVLNAYVQPIGRAYLERLERGLREEGVPGTVYTMLSGGGIAPIERAAATPIQLLESGPVAGVAGAALIGEAAGRRNLISLDVGGTTAKASLIQNGQMETRTNYRIERTSVFPGYPVQVPVVDIVEVGAGGGSIAWVDSSGAARVGPQSAGADPGPVAYGKGGTEPTLADANLVAGRYNAENYLGGEVPLDIEASHAAIARLGERINMHEAGVSLGVIRLGEALMAQALRLVSLERGRDPRDFSLVAFGGTGPAHAASLAAELLIPEVLIPRYPAVFSAWGMAMADLRLDRVRTVVLPLEEHYLDQLHAAWAELQNEVRIELYRETKDRLPGGGRRRPLLRGQAALRYAGQEHTVTVQAPQGQWGPSQLSRMINRFERAHRRRYGFRLDAPVELVNLHLAAILPTGQKEMARWRGGGPADEALRGTRHCLFREGWQEVPVYEREALAAGEQVEGPALIEEDATVTVLLEGQRLAVDTWGTFVIETRSSFRM